tara:strand:- start:5683 stop:7275 length:1593 start_codon:yes stop_codon:yes gene_type:complete
MKCSHIPYKKTGFFSKMISDYLEKNEDIQEFYHHYPDMEGFAAQILEKKNSFQESSRKVLVDVLQDQYRNVVTSQLTIKNINAIQNQETFTITTGHQLNLFTGPLYFLYKIISTINLSEHLATQFPDYHFIPIYWMASEDHDFEEINYFNFKGNKIDWNRAGGGAVGRFSLEGLETVFSQFSEHIENSKNAAYLKQLFKKAYLEQQTLSEATRYIVNELFKEYGLVILDADDQRLKNIFSPVIHDELINKTSFKTVSRTINRLEKSYKVQVKPREINLFYLLENARERITEEDGKFHIHNTNILFSTAEIIRELENHPERFSPNVITRTVYQEMILPNICYIGGGGELAYWLELKDYFDILDISFPILLLRNSVQIITNKQVTKLNKLVISYEELFLNNHNLIAKKIKENSDVQFSFSDAKELLTQQFLALRRVANSTDASFTGAVDAQQRKQLKGLENLKKRLLRAEKRKQSDLVRRITILQDQLLPNQSLEERQRNFSEYYLSYGHELIIALKKSLKPLRQVFTFLEL